MLMHENSIIDQNYLVALAYLAKLDHFDLYWTQSHPVGEDLVIAVFCGVFVCIVIDRMYEIIATRKLNNAFIKQHSIANNSKGTNKMK